MVSNEVFDRINAKLTAKAHAIYKELHGHVYDSLMNLEVFPLFQILKFPIIGGMVDWWVVCPGFLLKVEDDR